jgi:hypothetical protein
MRAHAHRELPADASLLRSWKRWEGGEHAPDAEYQPLVAATFGTVTAAIWPPAPRAELAADMDTLVGQPG